MGVCLSVGFGVIYMFSIGLFCLIPFVSVLLGMMYMAVMHIRSLLIPKKLKLLVNSLENPSSLARGRL